MIEIAIALAGLVTGYAVGHLHRREQDRRHIRALHKAVAYEQHTGHKLQKRITELERERYDRQHMEQTIASRFIAIRQDWS